MNERIKELAKKAGFQSYITTHEEDVAMFEKFAELIVKETLEVARAGIEFGDSMESAVERYFEIKL